MGDDSAYDAKRHAAVQRSCDYATGIFSARMTEIENLRNRSVVSLGLISASSALLALNNVIPRLGFWACAPLIFLAGALALSLPPLMSVRIVYPVDLKSFKAALNQMTPEEIDQALFDNTVAADEFAEHLARSTAAFTDNALRMGTLGLVILAAAVVLTEVDPLTSILVGFGAGVLVLAIVECWRHFSRIGLDVKVNTSRRG